MKKKKRKTPEMLAGSCRRASDTLLAVGNVTVESLRAIEGPSVRVSELVFGNPVYPIFLQKHILTCPHCKKMFYTGILDRLARSRMKEK